MSLVSLQFLLALAAKGTILLIATTFAAALAHRARASVRHALWASGLAGLLLVPVLSMGLPRWEIITLPATGVVSSVSAPALLPQSRAEISVPPWSATIDAARPITGAAVPGVRSSRSASPRLDAAQAVISAWLAGAALLLGWLLFGHFRVKAIVRRASRVLSPEWQASVEEGLRLAPPGCRVGFRETPASMPMATGILHPVVLLPAAGAGWTAAHRRDVVVHELAHVRRRDCLTHLTSAVACAIHWFNPLAWLAARQARVEREHSCDDAVLAAGALPSTYAQALLDTARSAPPVWATASAGLTMARPSHLAERLLAVLDSRRSRGRLGRVALGSASLGTLALLAPVAAMAPARAQRNEGTPAADAAVQASVQTPAPAHLHVSEPPMQGVRGTGAATMTPPQTTCPYSKTGSHRSVRLTNSMTITGMGSADDGKGNAFVAWTGADCSVVIHVVGEPSFTGDEADVAGFRGSGRFTV
ncbi:MAG TPA: M56 family metallopeptidase, partial [Gemmatimonadales bacterium]|nr:M56 family metallopeptidase [Gemmatimonadales bacterium]